mgnify:CR=1 FL=1
MVRKETNIEVPPTIGPYPVDLVKLLERGWKLDDAKDFMLRDMEPSLQSCDKTFIWEKFLFLEFLTLIEVV